MSQGRSYTLKKNRPGCLNLIWEEREFPALYSQPLNPPGQEWVPGTITKYIPVGETYRPTSPILFRGMSHPKRAYMKAFKCGDVLEVSSYYDEDMKPRYFQYGYTLSQSESKMSTLDLSELDLSEFAIEEEQEEERTPEQLTLEDYVNGCIEPDSDLEEDLENTEPISDEKRDFYRLRSLKRAQRTCRRKIEAHRMTMMWTVTFALPPENDLEKDEYLSRGIYRFLTGEEQRNREKIHKAWNVFVTQLRRVCKKEDISLKWLKVLERHDSEKTSEVKRNTFHIHIATDLRMNKHRLQRLWGYGQVWFTDYEKLQCKSAEGKTKNVDFGVQRDPAFYMSKYMEKDFDEAKTLNEKAYTSSQNTGVPKPIYQEDEIEDMKRDPKKAFNLKGMRPDVKNRVEKLTSLDAVKVEMPDIGHGQGVYKIEYQQVVEGKLVPVTGFVKKEIYDARLLLPMYRKRYERRKNARNKQQKMSAQLGFWVEHLEGKKGESHV